jgi:hypothetical protein
MLVRDRPLGFDDTSPYVSRGRGQLILWTISGCCSDPIKAKRASGGLIGSVEMNDLMRRDNPAAAQRHVPP